MKKNRINVKSLLALLLVSIMMFSLASCTSRKSDTAFLDHVSKVTEYVDDDESTEESSEPPTQEGYTPRPIVTHTINISPYNVIIAGTCEEGSVINVKNTADSKEKYSAKSLGNYFIIEIELPNQNLNYYDLTASVEGLKESTEYTIEVQYDAVAEKPNNLPVSLGKDSKLFLESLIASYTGSDLYTQTSIKTFKENLKKTINSKNTKYVFVTVPGKLTTYADELIPEVEDEDGNLSPAFKQETYNTKYTQIINAIASVEGADIIDLTETFLANKNGEYPLYYNTSSNISDYGSYLAYVAIMNYIEENTANETITDDASTDASSETEEDIASTEYKFSTLAGKGGNLIDAIGLDRDIFTEKYYYLDTFASTISKESEMTCKPSDIVIYADKETNTLYTDTTDEEVIGAFESIYFKTNRVELPSAVFLRDDTSNPIVAMLAEKFNNSYFEANNNFRLDCSAITQYAADGANCVDYVFVIVSENNIDQVFSAVVPTQG